MSTDAAHLDIIQIIIIIK